MQIVHAADLHLGSQLRGLDQHDSLPGEIIRAASMEAFRRIASLCIEREAELLLIAGDFYDTVAPLSVMLEAAAVLKSITAAGCNVVMIRGNHDAESKVPARLPGLERLHQLSTERAETVELELSAGRVAIHGRGFNTPSVPDNIVREYPQAVPGAFNIGLLHTSLEGSAQHGRYAPCDIADLVALGYDYWALGHIHQHAIVREAAPTIVYAGNPQGRHVNERGAHGCYVLDIANGALTCAPTHVELATIQWHRLDIDVAEVQLDGDDASAMDAISAHVVARLEELAAAAPDVRHIARVMISGETAAHVSLTQNLPEFTAQLHVDAAGISVAAVHIEQVRMKTSPPLPDPATLRDRTDAIGEFVTRLDSEVMDLSNSNGADGATFDIPLLDKVEERLARLGATAQAIAGQGLDAEALDAMRDDLLARLLSASASESAQEAAR